MHYVQSASYLDISKTAHLAILSCHVVLVGVYMSVVGHYSPTDLPLVQCLVVCVRSLDHSTVLYCQLLVAIGQLIAHLRRCSSDPQIGGFEY